jgi:hypothetical protein
MTAPNIGVASSNSTWDIVKCRLAEDRASDVIRADLVTVGNFYLTRICKEHKKAQFLTVQCLTLVLLALQNILASHAVVFWL